VSYGHPWAHYSGGYQHRVLGGPLGLPDLFYTAPDGMERKDHCGVLGYEAMHVRIHVENSYMYMTSTLSSNRHVTLHLGLYKARQGPLSL
jgi:hypothetical protein